MSKRILLITAALVFLYSSVSAQLMNSPWPKFHKDIKNTGFGGFGNNGSVGTTKGKLKWIFQTDGLRPVTASPVMDNNDHLYFGANDKNFYCVNRSTGYLIWKYETDGAIEFSTAAIDKNGIIYVGSTDGYLYAFDTINISLTAPAPIWRADVGSKEGAGVTSSPTIVEDPDAPGSSLVIVASNNGRVYAVRPNNTIKWTCPDPNTSTILNYGALWANPLIIDNGMTVVVASKDYSPSPRYVLTNLPAPEREYPNTLCPYLDTVAWTYFAPNVFAIDIQTGQEKWFYPSGCAPGGMFGSPIALADGGIILNYLYVPIEGCPTPPQDYAGRVISAIESGFTTNYPTDNSCLPFTAPLAEDIEPLTKVGKLFWATPTVFSDKTVFTPAGESIYRHLPGGPSYNEFFTSAGRIESSPVIDATLNLFFGCDAGKFYSLCASCSLSQSLINWTYPPGDEIITRSDNATPAEFKSTPSIDNDNKHSIYVGANNGLVYAFWDGAYITGHVQIDEFTPIAGVKIVIKNTQTNLETITYTSLSGDFTSEGLDNGMYTVTPQKNNTVFTPPLKHVPINNTDAYVLFTGSLAFTITGKVVDAVSGTGLGNVAVTIKGKTTEYSANVSTSDNGTYTFSNIGFDSYTVTPSLPGWGFEPAVITKAIPVGTTPGGQTFTLEPDFAGTLGYQISGKVIDPSILDNTTENGIEGVLVTLVGDATFIPVQRTTNAQGQYSFTGLPNGTYKITPSRALYKFSPNTQSVQINDASVLDQNFYGAIGITISGTIKLSGTDTSFDGFSVNLYRDDETFWSKIFNRNQPRTLVGTATVASIGFFIFMGVTAGKYIVEPSAANYGFDPASKKVSAIADVANLMFTASAGFTISGRFANLFNIAEPDITVNLTNDTTGVAAVTTTKLDGTYTFTGLEAGTYTVTPEQSTSYYVTPASRNVTISLESQSKINFRVYSFCSKTIINLPFWGSDGAEIYIIGTNFGPPPTDNTTAVAISLSDGTETSMPAGVYFGTNDPSTWVSATVTSWNPFFVTAKVPVLDGRLMRVWVVRGGLTTCIKILPTNFFINTRT